MLPELINKSQNIEVYNKSFAENMSDGYTFEIKKKQKLGVRFVYYDKSNHTLLVSYANTNRVHLLNLLTGELTYFDHHTSTVRNLQVLNNSEIISASWDRTVCVSSMNDNSFLRLRLTEKGTTGRVPHVAVSTDNKFAFTYSYDSDVCYSRTSNTIRMWNLSDGQLIRTFQLPGTHIATRRCGSCEVFDNRLYSVSDTGHLHIYDVNSGELLFEKFFNELMEAICIIPSINMIAIAGDNGNIFLCDLSGSVIAKQIRGHNSSISQLFTFPGKPDILCSVSFDGSTKLWQLPILNKLFSFPKLKLIGTAQVYGVSLWSSTIINDHLLCAGEECDIQIYDLKNMAEPKFKGKLVFSKDSYAFLSDSNTFYASSDLSLMQVLSKKDRSPLNDEKYAEYLLRANCNFKVFKDLFSSEEKKMEELQNKSFGFFQLR